MIVVFWLIKLSLLLVGAGMIVESLGWYELAGIWVFSVGLMMRAEGRR